MVRQQANELRAGQKVDTVLGVFAISLARYNRGNRSGDPYLRLVLGDRTGNMEARIWDTDIALEVYRTVKVEDLVSVCGTVQEYNGLQINVSTCQRHNWEGVDPADFRAISAKPLGDMWQLWDRFLGEIQGAHWQKLLKIICTDDFRQQFAAAPAGRQVHHSYGGGLLEHSLEVMQYCNVSFGIQGQGMDKDLLLVGAMLHDVGKVEEYDLNSFTFQLTERAKLLGGHITLGRDMIRSWIDACEGFPAHEAQALEHIILSHHGVPEWGSPVPPKTLEAICIHQADLLSARINQAYQVVSAATGREGSWSAFDRYLGRSLLIPESLSNEEDEKIWD